MSPPEPKVAKTSGIGEIMLKMAKFNETALFPILVRIGANFAFFRKFGSPGAIFRSGPDSGLPEDPPGGSSGGPESTPRGGSKMGPAGTPFLKGPGRSRDIWHRFALKSGL